MLLKAPPRYMAKSLMDTAMWRWLGAGVRTQELSHWTQSVILHWWIGWPPVWGAGCHKLLNLHNLSIRSFTRHEWSTIRRGNQKVRRWLRSSAQFEICISGIFYFEILQTCKCQWAHLSMRVAIKVSIDLFKSDENRSQHRVNIKPIHVKIEWISIQNRSDINLKWFKIDLKIIKSCSWSEQISAQNQSDSNLNLFKI